MSPQVAAIIAGAITVIGTLGAQILFRRWSKQDTEKTLKEQGAQLDRTLEAQSDQLKQTLDEQRTRTLNERFATAAEQIGSERPAVRLAGVYAIAGLADDWPEKQQTCIDVLCAYLRLPYKPPGQDAPVHERLSSGAILEVRHTVIRVITAHLRDGAAPSWQGLNFDLTGVVFVGGDFSEAVFSGGEVSFRDAQFSGGTVNFTGAGFGGGTVNFGPMFFLPGAKFSGGTVDFTGAGFGGGLVLFGQTKFSGGTLDFSNAKFYGGTVDFFHAQFSGGTVRFTGESGPAKFSGGTLDFSSPADWSFPPRFPWTDTPPQGVKLPEKEDQSQAEGSAD